MSGPIFLWTTRRSYLPNAQRPMLFSKKRLVIFGCGYVGGALAAVAQAGGARVTALTRNAARADELRRRGIDVVVGDLARTDWHAAIAPGPDFVLNAVSAAAFTPDGYRHSYVDGARSILAWAGRGGSPVGTLVYTSSTGVYPQDGGVRVDESAPLVGAGPTGQVLAEAEEVFRRAPAPVVGRAFILRLAGIYGPGRHALLDQLRAGVEVIAGRGGHRLNLVHRDDVVGAVSACFGARQEIAGGTFNVSDGQPASRAEVVAWLAAQLGRPAPRFDEAAPTTRRGGAGVPDRVIMSEALRGAVGWSPQFPSFRKGYAALLAGEKV